MSNLWTGLAILIWMGLGATIGIGAMAVLVVGRDSDEPDFPPYSWMLGQPCWMVVNGDFEKFRVVAVSHKGAVAIRRWDDDSGKHVKWIPKRHVKAGCVVFGECPETGQVVS